jgi:hypothetical protein
MVVKSGRGSLLVKGAALALEVWAGVPVATVVVVSTNDEIDTAEVTVNEVDNSVEITDCEGDTDDVADVN